MAIPLGDQLNMYRNMALIRRFEEGVAEAYAAACCWPAFSSRFS